MDEALREQALERPTDGSVDPASPICQHGSKRIEVRCGEVRGHNLVEVLTGGPAARCSVSEEFKGVVQHADLWTVKQAAPGFQRERDPSVIQRVGEGLMAHDAFAGLPGRIV